MHKTNVNTESPKHKGVAEETLQNLRELAGPDLQGSLFRQFDADAMGERDRLFGIAGRALNKSFDTIYAIGGMVDLVRANNEDGSDFHKILDDNTQAQLLTGVALLSSELNDTLSDIASMFRKEMKGGAQ